METSRYIQLLLLLIGLIAGVIFFILPKGGDPVPPTTSSFIPRSDFYNQIVIPQGALAILETESQASFLLVHQDSIYNETYWGNSLLANKNGLERAQIGVKLSGQQDVYTLAEDFVFTGFHWKRSSYRGAVTLVSQPKENELLVVVPGKKVVLIVSGIKEGNATESKDVLLDRVWKMLSFE